VAGRPAGRTCAHPAWVRSRHSVRESFGGGRQFSGVCWRRSAGRCCRVLARRATFRLRDNPPLRWRRHRLPAAGPRMVRPPPTPGISVESLKQGLADLHGRTFSALGVSVGADRLDRIRPDNPNGAWRTVSDEQRREALKGAKANATARVIESLRPIDLGNGKRLDEALNVPGVSEDLRHWIASRPVTSVEFGDDLQVRLTLAAPAEDLWPVLQRALAQQRQVQGLPTNPDGWEHLRQEVLHDAAPAVGRGMA